MFFKNKKVLVTGSAGLVGSNLIQQLLAEGAQVRGTLRRRPPVVEDKRIEYIRVDLTKGQDCRRALSGVEYVFHCAAETHGAAFMAKTPLALVTPNVLINAQILKAAYAAGVKKFLWLSSSTGYPPTGARMVKEKEMFEGDPYEKYFFVGWMKRFTEVLCRMYGEKMAKPMTAIVLRPTNIYGPNDDFEFETSHVIPALIRKVVERWDPIEVWGTGDDIRDAIYVDDMVKAMLSAMEKVSGYDVFNIGLGRAASVKEILAMLLDIDDYQAARIKFEPGKPTMIPIRLVDVSKAKRILNFRAKIDFKEGLAKTVQWYRESRALPRPVW